MITFDLDGTLWDSNIILLKAKNDLFNSLIYKFNNILNIYPTSEEYFFIFFLFIKIVMKMQCLNIVKYIKNYIINGEN